MNVLVIAFWVLVALAEAGLFFGAVGWLIWGLMKWDDREYLGYEKGYAPRGPFPLRRTAGCVAIVLAAITLGIWTIGTFAGGDDASHCGPGTHYIVLHSGKYSTWECTA